MGFQDQLDQVALEVSEALGQAIPIIHHVAAPDDDPVTQAPTSYDPVARKAEITGYGGVNPQREGLEVDAKHRVRVFGVGVDVSVRDELEWSGQRHQVLRVFGQLRPDGGRWARVVMTT